MDGTKKAVAPPTEALAGLVERVTFHSTETGFCVLRVKVRGQRDPVTVVGHAALISTGEWVSASGTWVNDRTHSLQFKPSFLKATAPTTLRALRSTSARESGGEKLAGSAVHQPKLGFRPGLFAAVTPPPKLSCGCNSVHRNIQNAEPQS